MLLGTEFHLPILLWQALRYQWTLLKQCSHLCYNCIFYWNWIGIHLCLLKKIRRPWGKKKLKYLGKRLGSIYIPLQRQKKAQTKSICETENHARYGTVVAAPPLGSTSSSKYTVLTRGEDMPRMGARSVGSHGPPNNYREEGKQKKSLDTTLGIMEAQLLHSWKEFRFPQIAWSCYTIIF